jgi:ABC-type transporter Mla MlaB component
MTHHVAVAIRPGEHACCRFAHAADRRRVAVAQVRDGIARGHRVVYLGDCDDVGAFVAELVAVEPAIEPALASGQLVVRRACDAYTPDGTFEIERAVRAMEDDHTAALADGYQGLTITGEMGTSLTAAPGAESLDEYEQRLDAADTSTSVLLCQYDHRRFDPATLSELALCHRVDLAPELAAIGRDGGLAAARVRPDTLRLAGELDFGSAQDLAEVLQAHYHGRLDLDVADLSFVDVAGLRALRGRTGQRLRIAGASQTVRRLLGLLAWDTDPGVEIVDAG